jgi:putative membrane protein
MTGFGMHRVALALAAISTSLVLIASSSNSGAQSGSDDKSFVEAALKGGMSEVDLGNLAVKKGASEDVRAFGQRMVTDHTKMGEHMKAVAGEIGVTPPSMAGASDIALKAELEVLSGDAFDKAYIKAMVKDHEEDLKDFKKEAADGSLPAVKSAAHDGEMVITHHLEMIRKIAAAHNISE